MDGKNEWRIDTSVTIKHSDSNTTYSMRYFLNYQLLTAETPGKEHLHISSVSCSVFLGHPSLSVTEYSVNQYGHSYTTNSTPALCNLDYTKKYLSGLTRMDYIFIKARRGANKTTSFKSVLRLLSSLG